MLSLWVLLMSEFYCCGCGRRGIPISRDGRRQREAGHLKKLWCLNCKKEINHVECKPFTKYTYDDFLIEYENGNFDDECNRIMPYGLFRDKLHREGKL